MVGVHPQVRLFVPCFVTHNSRPIVLGLPGEEREEASRPPYLGQLLENVLVDHDAFEGTQGVAVGREDGGWVGGWVGGWEELATYYLPGDDVDRGVAGQVAGGATVVWVWVGG